MAKKADKKTLKKMDKAQKAEKKEKKSKRKGAKKEAKLSPKARLEMVATAAYYIAEAHGFTPGRAETDWLEAEHQIEAKLRKSK